MGLTGFMLIAGIMLIVTGCAAPGAGTGRQAQAERQAGTGQQAEVVVPIPMMLDAGRLRLPLEQYMFTDRDMAALRQAQAVLTRACMKRFGFDWQPATPDSGAGDAARPGSRAEVGDAARPRFEVEAGDAANMAHRYGLTDPQAATEHGYHNTGPGSGTPRSAPGAKLSAAQAPVLTGASQDGSAAPRTYHGVPIPAGGCLGEAVLGLSGTPGVLGDGELVTNIDIGSYNQSYSDTRVTEVFRKWSACMAAAGFAYPNPTAAPGDDPQFLGAAPSALEIAIAKSDVECKRRTNLVGIWYAVDSAYQQVAIAHLPKKLAGIKQHNAVELAKARTVLSNTQLAP